MFDSKLQRKSGSRGGWWRRALRKVRHVPPAYLLEPEIFEGLIDKEIARCRRRPQSHEFSIIQIANSGAPQTNPALLAFLQGFASRKRITDEMGMWLGQVAILLPETGREGALNVANFIEAEFRHRGLKHELGIYVFPWDDPLASSSGDIDTLGEEEASGLVDGESRVEDGAPSANRNKNMVRMTARPASRSVRTQLVTRFDQEFAKQVVEFRGQRDPFWKRGIDLLGALLLLLLLAPLLLLVVWMIRRDSRGPALFTQWREGKGGKPFKIYKFRTMIVGADDEKDRLRATSEQDGPAFKLTDDPRVTRIGRFLRKSCIDELPQLINVLKGEMSLVGPRPLPVRESVQCKLWHRQRLQVTPGLTCIWQVFGGRKVSFEEWMRMDLEYVKQRGLLLDLKLILFTFGKVVMQRGSV